MWQLWTIFHFLSYCWNIVLPLIVHIGTKCPCLPNRVYVFIGGWSMWEQCNINSQHKTNVDYTAMPNFQTRNYPLRLKSTPILFLESYCWCSMQSGFCRTHPTGDKPEQQMMANFQLSATKHEKADTNINTKHKMLATGKHNHKMMATDTNTS